MAVNAASGSSSYVNKASSNKGFSGLASGVDTESMVEQLLSGTQTKIDKQNAIKQQLEWKQEIYRDVISQINNFQTKFFSYSSDTNLLSESFFSAMNAASTSNAFKATATSAAATGTSRLEVRRLATKTSLTSGEAVSAQLTGSVSKEGLEKLVKAQLGEEGDYTIQFNVGGKTVEADLKDLFVSEDGKSFTNLSTREMDAALQSKLEEAFADTDVKVTVRDGSLSLVTEGDGRANVSVASGSGSLALQRLGLTAGSTAVSRASAKTSTLSGKVDDTPTMSFTVTLDGLRKTVKLDLRDIMNDDGSVDTGKVQDALQAGLDKVHGSGQIRVSQDDDGSFSMVVGAGRQVTVGGTADTLEALGLKNGQSNRLSTATQLKDLSLRTPLQGGSYRFTINGEEFHFDETATVGEVLEAVNRSDAGVRMLYRAQDDSFVLESVESGAGKGIELAQSEGNLLGALFGAGIEPGKGLSSYKLTVTTKGEGEDAEETTTDATADTTLKELGLTLYDAEGNALDEETKLSELTEKTGGVLTYQDGRLVYDDSDADAAKNVLTGAEGTGEAARTLFGVAFDALGKGVDGVKAATMVQGQNALVSIDGLVTERSSNNFSVNGINYDLTGLTGKYEDVELGSGTTAIFYNNAEGKRVKLDLADLKEGQYIDDGVLYDTDGSVLGSGCHYFEDYAAFKNNEATPLNDLMVGEGGKLQRFVGEEATITVTQNTDQIMDGIKSFIDEYNKLVKTLNDYLDEETNYRDYAPLTADQKAEMSEREIELWEEKAKQGLLHRDSTIQNFLQSMRTVMYQKPAGGYALYEMGIETGAWETKGQLQFSTDGEAKLRQMLESDPTAVVKLFTDPDEGLGAKLNEVLNATARTSSANPGTLVQMAGVKGMASEKTNTMYDRIKAIDSKIESLKNTYEKEKTRYWNQFTTMEQLISQMNTQSSYLASMFSY